MDQKLTARAASFLNTGNRGTVALLVLVGLFTAVAFKLRFVQDDAFISFRYAENLSAGHGLLFNPGEAPVEGYTNFLWTLLLAAGMRLGADPISTSYLLGMACFVGSLLLTYWIALSILGSVMQALVALLLIGTNYTFLCYATGGLETQLQTLLLLSIFALTLKPRDGGPITVRRLAVFSTLCALALMTRLDSAIFVAVCGGALIVRITKTPATNARRTVAISTLLAPAVILVGGWLLWKLTYYGSVLPNTYAVKVGGGTSVVGGLTYTLLFLATYFLITHLLVGVALAKDLLRASHAGHSLLLLVMIAWTAYVIWVGGDFMEFRFFVPILPLLMISIVWLVQNLLGQESIRIALLVLVVLGSLYHWRFYDTTNGIGSIWTLRKYIESPQEDWPGVGKALNRLFYRDGRTVTVAALPCGAIPFYSRLRTVDMLGLNDPWIARNGIRIGTLPGHTRLAPLKYLVERGVHLVVAHPRVQPLEAPHPEYDLAEISRFLVQPVKGSELPETARIIEFQVNETHRVTVLYLQKCSAVEAAILDGRVRRLPIAR